MICLHLSCIKCRIFRGKAIISLKAEIDANIPKVTPGGTFSSSAYGRKRNNRFSARVVDCENSDEIKKDVNDGMVNV